MWGSMNKIINQQHAATNCHMQIVCVNQPLLRFCHLKVITNTQVVFNHISKHKEEIWKCYA